MYYLKYRPQTISELDNSQVREKIGNVLKNKDLPHAMLFVGSKGMGKTSTARIVAKAVNCLNNAFNNKGDSIEPCNNCSNCETISKGSSPDVVEQDAASNRGIDEVRKLIKEASFSPMTGKYRVYIIDEAHMITNDAFNALLKTLEEPPQTVLFILATTNEEKLPSTIISRCLRVPFGQAKKEDIMHMLDRVAKNEKLDISDELKELIVKACDDSFRDASKMLEELVMQNKLDVEAAKNYIGVHNQNDLLELLKKPEMKESLEWIETAVNNGGDPQLIIESLLHTLHQQLLLKTNVNTDDKVDYGLSVKEISQLMKLLHEANGMMRMSPIPALPLEIAIVEFYNQRK